MFDKRIAVIDIEASNLMPMAEDIWVVCCKIVGEDKVEAFQEPLPFVRWLAEKGPEIIVGHNLDGFDKACLSKCWGVDLEQEVIDTLLLSQFLNPDRDGGHSLESWGVRLGFPKGNFNDWSKYSLEMEEYCKNDVLLTEKVLLTLLREVENYGIENFFEQPFWKAAVKNFWLMSQQAHTGIAFDVKKAEQLKEHIEQLMLEIEVEVEPQLPSRPLNKGELDEWRFPAKPFRKDGSISALMEKWILRTGAILNRDDKTVELDGVVFPIRGGEPTRTTGPMRLANQADLKDFLVESGWTPSLWNVQRDARGKPMRDGHGKVITTSPKMQENGKLCPNLEELQGDLVKPVVKWLSLRNRKSVVEGWLANERLKYDGRLSAGASGFASTFRQRHTTVVNVPKAQDDVTLGKEMRELFCADEGMVLVGYDAVALENRVEAHYCLKYPGGKEHAENILDGDPHTKNAFVFYPEELTKEGFTYDQEGLKDHPIFKAFRSRSKNSRYALSYGCSPKKLATTLRQPEWKGEELYEAFWRANPALTALRERLTMFWETTGEKRWIRGVDGRKVVTRSKHAIINTLFQSCGAICMDYSALFMDKWLGGLGIDNEGRPCYSYKGHNVYRMIFMHDEFVWGCHEDIAEEIGQLGVKSIQKAGEYLKLSVPLEGSAMIGQNWSMIH